MTVSIESWKSELRDLRDRLDAAPVPSMGSPAIELRMTSEQHRRAMAMKKETSERINRMNAIHLRLGQMVAERPDLCRLAGVSQATIDDPKPGSRWTSAVSELAGGEPFIDVNLGIFMQRSVVAIGRLIAVHLESAPDANSKTPTWPEGEWRTAAWYRDATSDLLLPDAMLKAGARKAISRHRLSDDDDWRYQVASVIANWPEHRRVIEARIRADTNGQERTPPDK